MSFLKSFKINGTEFVAQKATDLLMPKANDGDPDVTVAEAVAAVQDKLAGYEEIVLQMDDGTNQNNVDKLILAKQHYIYYNMFAQNPQGNRLGMKPGAYDANYNYLGPLAQDYTGWNETDGAASEYDVCGWQHESEFSEQVCSYIFMDKILAKYPTARGIKLRNWSMIEANAVKNAEPNQLDWICLTPYGVSSQNLYDYDNDGVLQFVYGEPYTSAIKTPLCNVPDFVSTIYVEANNAQEAPWGTAATVEHNGLIPIT